MSRLRDAARAAYSGWAGWYHQRHWPDDEFAAARKIRTEAIREAGLMRAKIEELRDRIRKCEQVAQLADELLDEG